jgi:hypothetical protein
VSGRVEDEGGSGGSMRSSGTAVARYVADLHRPLRLIVLFIEDVKTFSGHLPQQQST